MTRATSEAATSRRFLASDAPAAAVEIAARRVTAVSLGKGDAPVVQGWATETLPEGAIVPSLNSPNIIDPAAVGEALRRALSRAGVRTKRVGLIIPDLAAKVSLVPFDTVPERQEDLAELINWQVRKSAPFRIEDAQVAFVPGAPHGDKGRTFVVTLARKDIVRQYEDACAAAGVHAGIVDLASFNVINAVLGSRLRAGAGLDAAAGADWLLVSTTEESQTLAILRGDALMFFRNRPIEGDETLPDLVHQTAMYYEDRLQGAGFERVVLAGGAAWSGESVRKSLADRLHAPVASIEPRQVAGFTGREFDDLQPAAADALIAPLGLLIRERAVHA